MPSTAILPQTQTGVSIWEQRLALATAIRKELLDTGFTPTPTSGKRPVLSDWQKKTTTNHPEIELWAKLFPNAFNTGILTALTPTFDADLLIPAAATAVEDLVRECYEERGRILIRFGLKPKRAILFRAAHPFRKIRVALSHVARPNRKQDAVEFLGDGQQVIVRGIHPDTGKPYDWFGGRPGEVRRDELPEITQEEAQALVDNAVALLVRDHGYRVCTALKKRMNGSKAKPRIDWSTLPDTIRDGARDVTATSIIGSLLRHDNDINLVRTLMQGWNAGCCVPPLPPGDIEKIINSIAGAEMKRRKGSPRG